MSPIDRARQREPGKLSFGTSPPGSGSHLSAELFKARTGIDVTLCPTKARPR